LHLQNSGETTYKLFQIQMLTLCRFSSPSSSAKASTTSPIRRRGWASLAKPALGAALAMGSLAAGQARALTISIYNSFKEGLIKPGQID
jgi:hypothetical protein